MGINLPHNPTLPFLDIYPKIYAQTYYKDICSSMFISALFVIARTWKMSRNPLIKKQIKEMWCIYKMEYYIVTKNNDILKFTCKWIELEKNPE